MNYRILVILLFALSTVFAVANTFDLVNAIENEDAILIDAAIDEGYYDNESNPITYDEYQEIYEAENGKQEKEKEKEYGSEETGKVKEQEMEQEGKPEFVVSKNNMNKTQVNTNNVIATTDYEVVVSNNSLQVKMNNGQNKEIKVMPDTASAKAIENANMHSINGIVLKDVGKPVYEINGSSKGKFFGIFPMEVEISVQIDAETGEVLEVKKPWWSFLIIVDENA